MFRMQREPGLKWLFLDLNSYFASVEQQECPELRGRPVAIVPLQTDSTCAIAASKEAKLYGVKTGMPIYEAKRMCPGLRCVLARHDVYVDYHHRVIEEFINHAPIDKIWSIDEIACRLPPGRRAPAKAVQIAHNIKAGLRKNIGAQVTASIGIAPNSLLAKIAADMKKPDGMTLIAQEDLPGLLLDLKLTDIPGVGANMERRLHKAGIRTMEQLWHTAPKQMRKIWGSVQGERLWYWLHGYDFAAPETGNVMIGHSRVLDPDLRRPDRARLMARRLLTKAVYRLRRKEFYATTLSLSVRSVMGQRWAGERRVTPACDPFTFLQALEELWTRMSAANTQRVNLKKISVLLTGLKRADEITGDMLATTPTQIHQLQRQESLAVALDRLQNKYHKETVWLGVTPKTLSGHVGTKIAFARVPEREEFWH